MMIMWMNTEILRKLLATFLCYWAFIFFVTYLRNSENYWTESKIWSNIRNLRSPSSLVLCVCESLSVCLSLSFIYLLSTNSITWTHITSSTALQGMTHLVWVSRKSKLEHVLSCTGTNVHLDHYHSHSRN